MTTIIEHWDLINGTPDTGTVRFWPPVQRLAAHGPGQISTTTVTANLTNGDLSIAVEPGLIYVRVLLSGGASNAIIVTIPDSLTPVRLSTLAPMVPPPLLVSTQGPPGPPGAVSTVPGPPGTASTVPGPPGTASIAYDTDGVPYLLI